MAPTAPPITMQDAILRLTSYWSGAGCVVGQPMNTEVGAGTLNPSTYLRVLGPEPWRTAYVEPSVRPDDSRYGDNPNRMQTHTQFQVILKPDPGDPQELYLASLAALGIDTQRHDVRFVEDNWESPALGAWGLGWEVWLDGLEITQFTYFQQAGGLSLDPVSVEITYGLERILMALQGVSHFKDIRYTDDIAYGELVGEAEREMSRFYLDDADVDAQRRLFEVYAEEARRLIDLRLPIPAHAHVLKCSHTFNVLDSRGAVGTTERARAFARMRRLAHEVAELWNERRTELSHPLGTTAAADARPPAADGDAPDGPATLVLELGTEELPSQEVPSLVAQVDAALRRALDDEQLSHDGIAVTGTPRRIVATVSGLADRQPDRDVRVRGPKVDIAFADDGTPTKAAEGFARKQGMAVAELAQEEDGGATHLVARRTEQGRPALDVLADMLPGLLRGLSVGRSMRWAAGDGTAFSRPIRWIVALLGDAVVPFGYGTLASGRTTRLLRDAAQPEVEVPSADSHRSVLEEAGIVVDRDERARRIVADAHARAAEVGGVIDTEGEAALLEEVTDLIECPVTILGRFEDEFLRLPPEVLTVVMKKHQRYLPVRTADGDLLPAFVAVANGPIDADAVRAGNEAVLRARYADAAFFFDRDVEVPLESFRDGLATLTFEERAGSMLDRSDRIAAIAAHLCDVIDVDDDERATVARAAHLAKADLASSMVVELSSLAAVMGRIYAERSGEPPAVAQAVFEHALPRHAGDLLPSSRAGAILAVADRLDALSALFAVGAQPTGSNDPYALRRAAAGLTQIIVDQGLDLDLDALLTHAAGVQPVEIDGDAAAELRDFVARRLEQRLADDGHPTQLVQAVMGQAVAAHANRPALVVSVLAELETMVDEPVLQAVAAAYRRVGRIAKDQRPDDAVHPDRFTEDAERALWAAYEAAASDEDVDLARGEGPGGVPSLRALVTASERLVDPIERFFEDVLVMADDPAVRTNRLALLAAIRDLGAGLVDWEAVPER